MLVSWALDPRKGHINAKPSLKYVEYIDLLSKSQKQRKLTIKLGRQNTWYSLKAIENQGSDSRNFNINSKLFLGSSKSYQIYCLAYHSLSCLSMLLSHIYFHEIPTSARVSNLGIPE